MAKAGSVKLVLQKPFFNGIANILEYFADDENRFTEFAKYMQSKFLKHGRFFINDDEENFIVYLYNNEADLLIKMMAIFTAAATDIPKDFYSEYRNKQLEKSE